MRASTPWNREIVSVRSCVRARGVCHVSSEGESPPSGLYLLSFPSGGRIFYPLGNLIFVVQVSFRREFPKRVSQEKFPREIFKRDFQERLPREISKRGFQDIFPREISKIDSQRDFQGSCCKRLFQESFPREFPKRDSQERFPS